MDDHLCTDYDVDYLAWLDQQAALLRAGKFHQLDTANLIEELEYMSDKQKNALKNRLRILIAHLLKCQFQPTHISGSWRGTLDTQRYKIERLLEKSPSLKPRLDAAIAWAYPHAIRLAAAETGLPRSAFPVQNPYSTAQILDPDYQPGA